MTSGLIGNTITRFKPPRLHRTVGRLTARAISHDRPLPEDMGLTFGGAFDEAHRRQTLVARAEGNRYRFDIRLQGDYETVFFDMRGPS